MSQPNTNEVDQNDHYAMDLDQPIAQRGQQQGISADKLTGSKSASSSQQASSGKSATRQGSSGKQQASADNDQPDLPLNQGEMWHEQMADAQGNEAED